MITVFIYSKNDGLFIRKELGHESSIINDINEYEDFTLVAPPELNKKWMWSGEAWVYLGEEEPPIEDMQAKVWEAIKQRRYEATVSGVYVPSVDKVFHTDATSVIQYNNIGNMIALGNFEPIQWKVMDNTWITMTEEVFKDLQIAMVQNTNRIYQVAEEHKANMMELDNPEDYDYSEGWNIIDPSN